MTRRQTFSQPDVEGLEYPLLEQEGEKDNYRLIGRSKTTGELVRILGTAEEVEKKVGKNLITVIDNSIEGRTKSFAKGIQELFLKLKKQYPLRESIDINKYKKGQDIIKDLIDLKGEKIGDLLDNSLKYLKDMGLTFTRTSDEYFKHDSYMASINVSFLGKDEIREKELNDRAESCAKKLQEVFLRIKNQNPDKELIDIDIYKDEEGQKAINDLVYGVGDEAGDLFDKNLKKSLSDINLTFTRPSYSYFTGKGKSHAARFNISQAA